MKPELIKSWNNNTALIYKDVLIYSIAGICASLFSIIPMMGWLEKLCNVLVIAGFAFFFVRIKNLAELSEGADAEALKKLTVGILCYFLGKMLTNIPAAGFVLGPIATIVGFVFMFLAYNALSKSATFPRPEGMKLLKIALIIGIVGGVFSIIPIIKIVGGILYIAEFVLILLGWKKVAVPVAE